MDNATPIANARSDAQPRLGIAHLMLWTVGIALVLATDGGSELTHPDIPPILRIMNAANRLSYALVYGALLSGWILFAWRWFRDGARFPVAPGHWLLLATGLSEYLTAGGRIVYSAWPVWEGTEFGDGWIDVTMFALSQATVGGLLLVAALRMGRCSRWQCALGLVTGCELAQALIWGWCIGASHFSVSYEMTWELSTLQWLSLLSGAVILIAVVLDWGTSAKFDWLHYAGVCAWLARFALPWFWMFMGRIFLSD